MSRTKIFIPILIALLISTLACATITRLTPTQAATPAQQSAATSKPAPPAALQPAGKDLTLGKPDAPAKIEVFEDFQCPACLKYSQTIEPQVIKELVDTGKASYVFRHFPFLDGGDLKGESQRAASASLCASEQGKFWDYKETLFNNWAGENNGAYNDKNLRSFAEDIDLNASAFDACFQEDRYRNLIEADLKSADAMGVHGTPSVFVNGTLLTPGYIPSFDDIKSAVDAAQP